MRKFGCRMISHHDHLLLFGGYGAPSGPTQPGSEFVKSTVFTDGRGWTNELHQYDTQEGCWSSPKVTGTRPPPCQGFSLTRTDGHHLVMFGGREPGGWSNDTYILDLSRMCWSKVVHPQGDPRPVGRYQHAAVCLVSDDGPTLLITGGRDKDNKVLDDVWLLDMKSGRWREVRGHSVQARISHTATAITHTPGLVEVVIFGGFSEYPKDYKTDADLTPLSHTVVLLLEYQQCLSTGGSAPTSEWVLTDLADSSQLGTPQRLRAKREKVTRALRTSTVTPVAAPSGGGLEGRNLEADRRVRVAEDRARGAEDRAREAVDRARDLAEQLRLEREQTQTRLQESEAEAQTRLQESEAGRLEAQTRLQESEAEKGRMVRELRQQAILAAQRVRQCEDELQRLQTQWAVDRAEIQVTEEELGRGSWATVSVATFRGARVAAKVIHNQILSQHNIQLFRREMDMAARIRHPNLLQFIGATQEGEMVILTELMPTSLRKQVENDYLPPKQTIAISLDVARALNYLHQMRPHPLIHRDISSANVLLEPLPNSHWRAKISDYGTVNLQQQLQTVGPGSPCYAAPEANDPTRQSPKMDIFSFGALLLEMLTGELPAPDERPRLLLKVFHQRLLALIQRCLSENREARPSASDIITELDP